MKRTGFLIQYIVLTGFALQQKVFRRTLLYLAGS